LPHFTEKVLKSPRFLEDLGRFFKPFFFWALLKSPYLANRF
jgi:hypothetical protein